MPSALPIGRASEKALPSVYFLYPPGLPDGDKPQTVDHFDYRPGKYVWTVNTYAYLSRMGFPCHLTDRLPEEGIVVTHREFFRNRMVPGPRQLFVCVVADFYRHPFAQLHLVQNGHHPLLVRRSPAWPAAYVPLWTETELKPRDPARGETFKNIGYFGLPTRLAPQLRSETFATLLRNHGFTFRIVDRHHWNDYSDTDAVLAVRSFAQLSYHKFPPTKLYNSWTAGVPALLGRESAFRAERRSDLDYFEVGSVGEILETLLRLRADPALRAQVARNCAQRAVEVSPEQIARRWTQFLTKTAAPAFESWQGQSATRRGAFLATRLLRYAGFTCVDFVARAQAYLRKRSRALLS
jgi:hypothetical protein